MMTPAEHELYQYLAAVSERCGRAENLFRIAVYEAGLNWRHAYRLMKRLRDSKRIAVRSRGRGRPLKIWIKNQEAKMDDKDLDELESDLIKELERMLVHAAGDSTTRLWEVQPPSSITHLAAEAVAKLFLAYERGYRMS